MRSWWSTCRWLRTWTGAASTSWTGRCCRAGRGPIQPDLYSGKHHTTGLNVRVACDLSGRLAWVSDPVNGHRHDTAALGLSDVMSGMDPANWIGDKGYIGNNMITPIRKPPHRDLLDWEKNFNRTVNQIRYKIERAIAHLTTWRILHTDYRRPFKTFAATISAVVALTFYTMVTE